MGRRQIFIRLAGCNLACRYCDTPTGYNQYCRIEKTPGGRDFFNLPNPLAPEQIAGLVRHFTPSLHHSVSLTGGEPLLHPGLLSDLIPGLPATREGIVLETNGTLPGNLEQVAGVIDYISMDIKLSNTGQSVPWEAHRLFLTLASARRVFVKVVVSRDTPPGEITAAAGLIAQINEKVPLIMQPATPAGGVRPASPAVMLELQLMALQYLNDVRIIPQTHALMRYL